MIYDKVKIARTLPTKMTPVAQDRSTRTNSKNRLLSVVNKLKFPHRNYLRVAPHHRADCYKSKNSHPHCGALFCLTTLAYFLPIMNFNAAWLRDWFVYTGKQWRRWWSLRWQLCRKSIANRRRASPVLATSAPQRMIECLTRLARFCFCCEIVSLGMNYIRP